ncbi:hypothetical protein ABZ754_25575 [Micromonospora purpureochromogenes]|uniref:hypothetical protein n=1 Tax=Micromonospora purpureochromogenes TaxID=47872 RepID=UPI0033E865A8
MTTGVRQAARDAVRPRAPRWPAPVALALLVGLAGVGYRLALLLGDTPRTNSDEATMGLAALHIARGEDFPVFFYGQAYMGALEAYLAAPLVALAGPSVFALRLPLLALYALFLFLSWRLTRRLGGDRWFALLVVGVLALGADRVVKNQLIAGGGYPELNPIGAGLALLTLDLVTGRPAGRRWRLAGFGFLAGLTVWVDPLLLPYVLALGAALVTMIGRDLRGRRGVLLAGAALVGAAPLLGYGLAHRDNPLAAAVTAGGGDAVASWADRLHGGLVLGPALGMGLCSPGHCATWQLWWALALPVLLVLAGVSAWLTVRADGARTVRVDGARAERADGARAERADGARAVRADGARAVRAGAAVRLALVAGAVGTLAAYTVSSAAGRTPVESARYLSCLAISLPALLWPLWTVARRRGPVDLPRLAAVGALVALLGTATVATAGALATVPANRAEAQRHRALVEALRERGVRHVYGEYWTCNRLTYATGEEIVCAVLDETLRPGLDRLPAYPRAVGESPAPAYVAPVGSPLARSLDRFPPPARQATTVDGWRIWLPIDT